MTSNTLQFVGNQELKEHTDSLGCLQIWNEEIVTGSADKTIQLWKYKIIEEKEKQQLILDNRTEGSGYFVPTATFPGHTHYVYCFTVWKDHLVSGSADKTIRIWKRDGTCIQILTEH